MGVDQTCKYSIMDCPYPPPLETEKKLITKFRSRVFDILKPGEDRSDYFLVRWIRAHSGNLEKSELHLRRSFEWRLEWGVDTILQQPWNYFMVTNYPVYSGGFDIHGHPVVYFPVGKWDFEKAVGRQVDFTKYFIQVFETIMSKIRESNIGKNPWDYQICQFLSILDWDGLNYTKLINSKALQLLLKVIDLFDIHYPEMVYRSFFINCPLMFPTLYAVMKPILREQTSSRIKMYGTNRGEWESKLKQCIHPDQLSSEYGGNLNVIQRSLISQQDLLNYK